MPQALGPPSFDTPWAGYQASGRYFRFIAATVTVPPRLIPAAHGGEAAITLSQAGGQAPARIEVAPGGYHGPVTWAAGHRSGRFQFFPQIRRPARAQHLLQPARHRLPHRH